MSHPEHAARDGDGGISDGAEPELRRSPEPVEWKPNVAPSKPLMDALDHLLKMPTRPLVCPACDGDGEPCELCNPGSVREVERAAAYRAGMLRAAEIVYGERVGANRDDDPVDRAHDRALNAAADAIRAEAAGGTPPDTERQ